MTVVTRIAPAPTGFLHIGNARTALFNWLFARHHQGTYLVRVEDTDQARSTNAAIDAIFKGFEWLGLLPDAPAVFQSQNAPRHVEAARQLFQEGKAYYCTCTPESLEAMRAEALAQGKQPRYDGRCREQHHTQGALRLRLTKEGSLTIHDMVQGEVTVENCQLDDFILLRSNETPTYMLSVVVDDHDMKITHIIRGDDHLTNAFRQTHLYQAFGWEIPKFAHVPLIHGPDGAKFSKRHGAPSVEEYKKMGYLPEAMCNYLVRLGWSHGDDEFISMEQAIAWFSPEHIGKSPARFDFKKLNNINAHYLRALSNQELLQRLNPFLKETLGRDLTPEEESILEKGLTGLKQRAETLVQLRDNALFYITPPKDYDAKGQSLLTPEALDHVQAFKASLETLSPWTEEALEQHARTFCEATGIGLGKMAQPLRVLLTGTTVSPSVFEIFYSLGKEKSMARLERAAP